MEDKQNQNEQQTQEQSVDTSNITIKDNGGGGLTAEVEPKMDNPMDDVETPEKNEETNGNEQENSTDTKSVEDDVAHQQQAEKDIKNDLESKGVNFDDLAAEYNKNGELSEDSLKSLEKAGYPKSVVDAYINGLKATTEKFVSQVKSFAGGEEGYEQLVSFLKTQPQSTIDAFNQSIQSGNLGQIQLTINGIKAEMTNKYGTANKTIMGNGSANMNPNGYTSMAEMTKDMSDPRYQTDPKFTREVMRKIKNASIF